MPAKKVSVFNSDGSNQRATVVVGQAFRGSDGELYVTDGDETIGALNVKIAGGSFSAGPLQYTRNGSTATVTRDTSTAANNRPLPVQMLVDDASGPVAFGSGSTNSSTMRVHVGNLTDIPVSISGFVSSILCNGGGTPYTSTAQSGAKTSLDVAAYQAGTWTFATETTLSTLSAKFGTQTDSNYGTPSASTQRVAAMVGVNGATVDSTNPLFTRIVGSAGAAVNVTSNSLQVTTGGNTVITDLSSFAGGTSTASGFDTSNALRVAAVVGFGTTAVSATNPLPVTQRPRTAVQLVSSTQNPYFQDFSTSNLTTSYTQITSGTTAISSFCATNNSSTAIYIATGAAASEVVQYILMPGETAMNVPLQIAAATRISIRTQTGTLTSGQFSLNALA